MKIKLLLGFCLRIARILPHQMLDRAFGVGVCVAVTQLVRIAEDIKCY